MRRALVIVLAVAAVLLPAGAAAAEEGADPIVTDPVATEEPAPDPVPEPDPEPAPEPSPDAEPEPTPEPTTVIGPSPPPIPDSVVQVPASIPARATEASRDTPHTVTVTVTAPAVTTTVTVVRDAPNTRQPAPHAAGFSRLPTVPPPMVLSVPFGHGAAAVAIVLALAGLAWWVLAPRRGRHAA